MIVFFDLDDTVFDTFPVLRRMVFEMTGFRPHSEAYLTPGNTEGHLATVLEDASFMGQTPLRPGYENIREWMLDMLLRYPSLRFAGATHRGYHPDAERKSKPIMDEVDFPFVEVVYIDPSVNPDKAKFLSEKHSEFLLVDDRPRFDGGGVLPPNVILIDQPWNKEIIPFYPEYRVTGIDELKQVLERYIAMGNRSSQILDDVGKPYVNWYHQDIRQLSTCLLNGFHPYPTSV